MESALIDRLNRENVGVLAAYDDPMDQTRLFTAKDGAEFVRQANTTLQNARRVFVLTARTAKELLDPDWERAKREALFTIDRAKERGDKSFLNEVLNRPRRSGITQGRKRDLQARRRTVENLKQHIEGDRSDLGRDEKAAIRSFKSTAIGQQAYEFSSDRDRAPTKEDRAALNAAVAFYKKHRKAAVSKGRSQSNRRNTLCWDAFQLWVLFGEPRIDQMLPEAQMAEFSELGFRLPAELDLLQQAIDIGKQQPLS